MALRRDILEQYLDGELTAGQMTQVEATLSGDAAGARLLAHLRQERLLRSAALQSYTPSTQDAGALARTMLDSLAQHEHAPLAKIGRTRWVRWMSAAAAALLLMAGSFYAGRSTAVPTVDTRVATVWEVIGQGDDGRMTTHVFSSLAEAEKFFKDTQAQTEQVASLDSGVF